MEIVALEETRLLKDDLSVSIEEDETNGTVNPDKLLSPKRSLRFDDYDVWDDFV
jgi:hypothetical protein